MCLEDPKIIAQDPSLFAHVIFSTVVEAAVRERGMLAESQGKVSFEIPKTKSMRNPRTLPKHIRMQLNQSRSSQSRGTRATNFAIFERKWTGPRVSRWERRCQLWTSIRICRHSPAMVSTSGTLYHQIHKTMA